MKKNLVFWGVLGTVCYLAAMSLVVFIRLDDFRCLKLNELGDFLAGVFGPLAFLWLVLGFIQQGRELKVSGEALKLQGEELKESVKQLENQALISAERFKLEREARLDQISLHRKLMSPILEVKCIKVVRSATEFTCQFEVSNNGAKVTGFQLFNLSGELRQSIIGPITLCEGQVELIEKSLIFNGLEDYLTFEATYTERDYERGARRFSGRVSVTKYGVCSLSLSCDF